MMAEGVFPRMENLDGGGATVPACSGLGSGSSAMSARALPPFVLGRSMAVGGEETRVSVACDDPNVRRGVCIACGNRALIRVMMHVCERCFNELEAER